MFEKSHSPVAVRRSRDHVLVTSTTTPYDVMKNSDSLVGRAPTVAKGILAGWRRFGQLSQWVIRACLISALMLVSACASRPDPPQIPLERFDLVRDLSGSTIGYGKFKAIDGTKREFVAKLSGVWDGKVLTLIEDFEFDDGEQERKTWRFEKLDNGEFSGTREDVVGTARGYQEGKVFRLEYDLRMPEDDGSRGKLLRFRDVLVKRRDGVVQNDANVAWLGFNVATVYFEIHRDAVPVEVSNPDKVEGTSS